MFADRNASSGVSQGPILGPLLFARLQTILSSVNFLSPLYVDDLQIFKIRTKIFSRKPSIGLVIALNVFMFFCSNIHTSKAKFFSL
jgi:hypothetical protein